MFLAIFTLSHAKMADQIATNRAKIAIISEVSMD
jgi:hypothetical protein